MSSSTLHPPFSLAIIGLGSNLGDSRKIVLNAMACLQHFADKPLLRSSLWQTSPVDCPWGSPPFVNAVVGLVPHKNETPESLLQILRSLEKQFGRAPRTIHNEPRRLDLDLIAFGNEKRDTPDLVLPHPRAHLRKFVLQPLSEIAPDLILVEKGKTVSELLAKLDTKERVAKLD